MALSSHAINGLTSETNLNELVEKVVALNNQIQISLEKLQIDIENTKEELKELEKTKQRKLRKKKKNKLQIINVKENLKVLFFLPNLHCN